MNASTNVRRPNLVNASLAAAAGLVSIYVVMCIYGGISDRSDRIRAREVRKKVVKLITQWELSQVEGKPLDKNLYNGILEADKEYRDIMWRHPEWFSLWDSHVKLPKHFEPLD